MNPAVSPGLLQPDSDAISDTIPLKDVDGFARRAVPYAVRPGYRPLELDLYTPALSNSAPVIVFLHGGGWRLGTRAVFCPAFASWSPDPFSRLVAEGFAVAAVDYRLSSEASFPAQLHDVQAAVRWLRLRADEIGIDPTRVIAWGESAGGHLAALLGLTSSVAELDDPAASSAESRAVTAVIDWYGPANLLTMDDQALPNAVARVALPDSRESMLIGAGVADSPDTARRASPVTYVQQGAPPFHIAHGDADRFVAPGQSAELAAALDEVGVDVQLTIVPGADHMWQNVRDTEVLFADAVRFARRHAGLS